MGKQNSNYSLRGLIRYFLHLGAFGFGGPVVLAGHMQDDLVEKRKWISKNEYSEGLALAQLAPGPLAAQLAIYIGWVRGGILGATLVGFAFILPSFVIVLVIAEFYRRYQSLPWLQGVFYGVGAAVIAIMAQSATKLIKKTMGKDRILLSLGFFNATLTFWLEQEILWVFLASGIFVMIARNGFPFLSQSKKILGLFPSWLLLGLAGPSNTNQLIEICLYFAKAGAFVFGSGLAIVPFLHGGVVNHYHWLNERQFLDAVAVAMITPGPVVITVAFIGYLVAGFLGSACAAIGVFVPTYLFVVVLAPYFSQVAKNRKIKAFVHGVTAAAVGSIVGAALILAKRAIIDLPTTLICTVSLFIIFNMKKVPEPVLILLAGLVGLAIQKLA